MYDFLLVRYCNYIALSCTVWEFFDVTLKSGAADTTLQILPPADTITLSCHPIELMTMQNVCYGWLRDTVVERRSPTGELSLSCARPTADG